MNYKSKGQGARATVRHCGRLTHDIMGTMLWDETERCGRKRHDDTEAAAKDASQSARREDPRKETRLAPKTQGA
jgi:hypothetical protein